jgi:hypothetical protein
MPCQLTCLLAHLSCRPACLIDPPALLIPCFVLCPLIMHLLLSKFKKYAFSNILRYLWVYHCAKAGTPYSVSRLLNTPVIIRQGLSLQLRLHSPMTICFKAFNLSPKSTFLKYLQVYHCGTAACQCRNTLQCR